MGWIVGALVGLMLGLPIGNGAWLACAIAGGVIGWLVTRKPDETLRKRVLALERQVEALRLEVRDLARAAGVAAVAQPADAGNAAAEPPARAEYDDADLPASEPAARAAERVIADADAVAADDADVADAAPPWRGPRIRIPNVAAIAWRWLTGGNTVVRVGIVLLFFGVAFLLRYAYERVEVPATLRLTGAALGAVALLVFGWRLRERRAGYALALQGGGVGILYLVVFAALRLYNLLPPLAAFVLLVAIAALSAFIALAQRSLALAVLGTSGGFLAPILASTGAGSHVALFSYYAVLNAGILAIALRESWRLLNVVGYGFTFVIGALWGWRYYRPELFWSTEPFLVLFFLFYVAIPILYARREAGRTQRYLDATLVFGVPLVGFGMQVALVRSFEYGAAWSALALAAFYLVLARAVWTRAGERMRMLAEAFLALGVVFATLAIPLAFEGRWTSAVWALEGAAIVWVGLRQGRLPARLFGIVLQGLAGLAFIADGGGLVAAPVAIANSAYLGAVFLAVGALVCAWLLERHAENVIALERLAAVVLFVWGVVWWFVAGANEIGMQVRSDFEWQAWLLYCTGTCLAFGELHRPLPWARARPVALLLLPLAAVVLLASMVQDAHPFAHAGALAWPLAVAAHFFLLRRLEEPGTRHGYWLHAGGMWLVTALAGWELAWAVDRVVAGETVWPAIGWALAPAAAIAFLALRGMRVAWPVAAWRDAYFAAGAIPVVAFLAGWWLIVNFVTSGDPAPIPYVPLLNPLDIAQAAVVLVVALWLVEARRLGVPPLDRLPLPWLQAELAAVAFLWLNAVLLRALHHWAGVPFDLERMLGSGLVQTAFSILWALVALASMVLATRRGVRVAWLAGAGLMAVVVVKLFIVDLASVGTVERIVSFIGVGLLMLVVGYYSPVPPRPVRDSQ